MLRRHAAIGIVGIICVLAWTGSRAGDQGAPAPASQQPPVAPVFRGGVNYVLVDAYPQRQGRIVEGLTPADFEILEDGKPQAIDAFEFVRVNARQADATYRDPNTVDEMNRQAADPRSRVFVVFLDTLHTKVDGSNRIRAPLVKTLNSIIEPADLFGVMTQDQRPQELTLGRRTTSVEDQLATYWTWGQKNRVAQETEPEEVMLTECFRTLIPPVGQSCRSPRPDSPRPWIVNDGAVRRPLDQLLIDRRREDRVLTSLADLVRHLGQLREARTVLMPITDGWRLFSEARELESEPMKDYRFCTTGMPRIGTGPGMAGLARPDHDSEFALCAAEVNRLASLDDARRFRDLVTLAQRSNVSFYPVSTAGLEVYSTGLDQRLGPNPNAFPGDDRLQEMEQIRARTSSLQTLAENTDGIAIVQQNALDAGMQRIVDDVSAYYLIGYYTTNTKADGKYRRIEVKLKTPGVTIHARRGYVAASENARADVPASGAPRGPAPLAVPAGIDGALAGLSRANPSSELLTYAAVSGTDLAIVVELGARPVGTGEWSSGAMVRVDVTTGDGTRVGAATETIPPGLRGALVRVPVAGSKGPWRIQAHVTAGRQSLDDRLELTPRDGRLLGEPLVFRATPSLRSSLWPAADLEFRRNERVHLEWPVLTPLDDRTARVLDRRGQPLPLGATLTERESDGRNSVVVDVPLTAFAEGDYVIEVTARGGAERERKYVAIRVVR
jgi:VWFA-related protein